MADERTTFIVPQRKSVQLLQRKGVIKQPEEATITAKREVTKRRGKPTPPPLPAKPNTAGTLPSQEEKVQPSFQLVHHLNTDCSELSNPGHSFPALNPMGERVEGSGPLMRE